MEPPAGPSGGASDGAPSHQLGRGGDLGFTATGFVETSALFGSIILASDAAVHAILAVDLDSVAQTYRLDSEDSYFVTLVHSLSISLSVTYLHVV